MLPVRGSWSWEWLWLKCRRVGKLLQERGHSVKHSRKRWVPELPAATDPNPQTWRWSAHKQNKTKQHVYTHKHNSEAASKPAQLRAIQYHNSIQPSTLLVRLPNRLLSTVHCGFGRDWPSPLLYQHRYLISSKSAIIYIITIIYIWQQTQNTHVLSLTLLKEIICIQHTSV